ncbi:hypothetical protein [Paucibacter sp. Y2R2-4]|uniref:hypothetical protein n=1 Tax=Paucibacter sp. Y2R2-4 TaxID=2893553 RepID=UPI0021E516E0|nr:hypothetical protein [Paucibacter sp. Y2R2-4]MCV2349344.1 hypothetical protein [Paucibacter sp. Y2R2-4]
MSGIQHNAAQVAFRVKATGRAIHAELSAALPTLAQQVTATMRQKAPKDLSLLGNTIRATRRSALEYFVEPTQDYAVYEEKGRKPGKGLPRFALGLPAVEWLRRRLVNAQQALNPKYRKPRKGSRRASEFEQELETRYLAWSRHVRAWGIKPQPFVKPTAEHHRQDVHTTLVAAVQRGIARSRGAQP